MAWRMEYIVPNDEWTNSVLTSSREKIPRDTKYLTAQRQAAVRLIRVTTARLTSIWRDTLGPAVKLGGWDRRTETAGAGGAETPFAPRRRAGGYLACHAESGQPGCTVKPTRRDAERRILVVQAHVTPPGIHILPASGQRSQNPPVGLSGDYCRATSLVWSNKDTSMVQDFRFWRKLHR